ncbi:MAG TPA: argininosuccinate lyase [Chryseosolibacter sp.]|nr:argininosuccinate lyase [Chryseosolibacter sp.]
MKLWQKDKTSAKEVEIFTVGKDQEMDLHLARFDVLGSLAHIEMLQTIGLLHKDELDKLRRELRQIYSTIEGGQFRVEPGVEDIHSQVELELTRRLGDIGKKIHSGRSRNDQVLVDIRLYFRDEIEQVVTRVHELFDLLLAQSEKHKDFLLPGYTHLQLAMPSSFGLWFGAYAESLVDDLQTVLAAFKVVNKNPLGSAAGYGSSFPLNRTLTTELLGFENLNQNVVYAQMGRGKSERIVTSAFSNVAATLSKLSMDACLFLNQNFGFISFPDELTTGSSIMPHKKNPDVFELIRARCNQLIALPNDVALITANLPSGYHRDMQLLKELVFPAVQNLKNCLQMAHLMLSNITVRKDILEDEKYKYLFSVEEVNRLVLAGMPFRDAYKKIGIDIEAGNFIPDKRISHTHEGSIGNLRLAEIRAMMHDVLRQFGFSRHHEAYNRLLSL